MRLATAPSRSGPHEQGRDTPKTYVLVLLDRDAELVPGMTKAQLRAIATRTTANTPAVPFTPDEAEAGIAIREERKAAARAA